MNNDELKKKIVEILEEGYTPIEYDDLDCGQTYFPTNEDVADALIAAGLAFDKATAILAKRTNGKTLILKAQYYDQMKHRADVAEKALKIVCRMQENLNILVDGRPWTKEEIYNRYIKQAEKELAEERKDD